MPLKTGSSRKVVSSNIKELVDTYKSKGRIGTSKPANKTAAIKQAIAISLNKTKEDKRMAAEKAKLLALAAEAKIVLDEKALDAVFREASAARDGGAAP